MPNCVHPIQESLLVIPYKSELNVIVLYTSSFKLVEHWCYVICMYTYYDGPYSLHEIPASHKKKPGF